MTSRREMLFRLSQAAVGIAVPPLGQGLVSGPCPRIQEVPDFVSMCFKDSKGTSHQVYVTGSTGPAVLLLHELPGLTARTFTTALELKGGYIVVVPLLFGKTFDDRAFRNIWSICGRADFDCNGGERTSPQVAWLRELTAAARKTWPDGKGVGAIGMCLTGIFPLAMLRAPEIVGPVLCQPTLPFNKFNILQPLGWFVDEDALAIHPDDLGYAKDRTSMPILGLRCTGDGKCPKERFRRLYNEFPQRFYRLDVPGDHHSTLVGDFCREGFDEVLAFFNQHLRTTPVNGTPAFPVLSKTSADEVTVAQCHGRQGSDHGPASTSHLQKKGPLCFSG
jgi:dienelactone hydrolase